MTDNIIMIPIFIYPVSADIQISTLSRYLNIPKSDILISILQIFKYLYFRYLNIHTSDILISLNQIFEYPYFGYFDIPKSEI